MGTRTMHDWGCTIMLWLVPFVSPDCATFRILEGDEWLVRRPDGDPGVRRWWNGFSALLDLANPDAAGWLRCELDALRTTTGATGGQPVVQQPHDKPATWGHEGLA